MRERFCVMKRIKDERHLTSKHKNLKTATNSSFSRPPKGKNLKSKTDRKKRYANNVKKILYRESNGMITMTERPLTGDLSHSHSLTLTLPLTLSGLGRTRGRDRLSAGECRDITALAWRWCYSEWWPASGSPASPAHLQSDGLKSEWVREWEGERERVWVYEGEIRERKRRVNTSLKRGSSIKSLAEGRSEWLHVKQEAMKRFNIASIALPSTEGGIPIDAPTIIW